MQDQEKKFIMISSINLIIKKREGSFTAQTIKSIENSKFLLNS